MTAKTPPRLASRYRARIDRAYHSVVAAVFVGVVIIGFFFLAAAADAARKPPYAPPPARLIIEGNTNLRDHVETLVMGFYLRPDPKPVRRMSVIDPSFDAGNGGYGLPSCGYYYGTGWVQAYGTAQWAGSTRTGWWRCWPDPYNGWAGTWVPT